MYKKKPRKGKLKNTPAPELQELLDLTREIKLVFSSLGAAGTKTFTSLSNDIASLVTSAGDLDTGFENITKQINKLKTTGADAYSNIIDIGTAATKSQKQMAIDSGNMFAKTYTVGLKAMEEGFNGLKNTIEEQAIEVSKFYGERVLKELNTALDSMQPDEAFKEIGKSLVAAAEAAGAGEAVIEDIETAVQNIKNTNLQTAKIIKEQYETVQKIKKAEEFRIETLKEINEETDAYKETYDKIATTIRSIWKDPKFNMAVFGGIGLSKLIGEADRLRETFGELRKDGQTIGQAWHGMTHSVNVLNTIIGADTTKAMMGLEAAMGDIHAITPKMSADVAFMGKQFGMSENEAGKLVGNITKLSGHTAESAIEATKYAGALAVASDVAPGRVMEQIANNSEEFAKYSSTSSKSLFTAAVAAVKMGVEFKTLTGAADHLLDFEESINDQMEASVLLGKELNFDRARELANKGDILGANKEILKQLGSEAEFNQMSVLQKKALAQATGYSIQDLSTMIKNQGKLNELTHDQVDALNNGSKITDVLAMSAENMMNNFDPKNIVFILSGLASMKHLLNGTLLATKLNSAAMLVWNKIKGTATGTGGKVIDKIKGNAKVTGGESPIEKTAGGISKINWSNVLKGAAAILIVSGALFVFAKALQEFEKIKDWTATVKGLGAFAITMGVIGAVGNFASKGLIALGSGLAAFGATVSAAAIPILIASGVLAAFGVALIPVTYALSLLVPVIKAFGTIITVVFKGMSDLVASVADGFVKLMGAVNMDNIHPLLLLGPALIGISVGLAAMALTGLAALPIIGALVGLASVAPALRGISGIFGSNEDESTTNKEDKKDNISVMEIVKRLDKLIKLVESGHDINIDGKKLGMYVALAAPRQQLTNLKPI